MIDEATYGELDRYFHSQMSAGEKSAFASRMKANEELRAEFQWLNIMLGSMKQQGRGVMKSAIAGAIAGVAFDEVEKYEPSMNKKSFFKKYWWVVTGAVVAIGVAVAIYLYTIQHANAEGHDESRDDYRQEAILGADGSGINNNIDSCKEQMLDPNLDSIFKSEGESRIAVRETVDVCFGDEVFLGDPRIGGTRPNKVALPDTAQKYEFTLWSNKDDLAEDPYRKDKSRSMGVTTGYKLYPPYTYKLDDDLMLNAPYYTCKGFKWEGIGSDTIYMTDKDGVRYMLLRGAGVRPLAPLARGSAH